MGSGLCLRVICLITARQKAVSNWRNGCGTFDPMSWPQTESFQHFKQFLGQNSPKIAQLYNRVIPNEGHISNLASLTSSRQLR